MRGSNQLCLPNNLFYLGWSTVVVKSVKSVVENVYGIFKLISNSTKMNQQTPPANSTHQTPLKLNSRTQPTNSAHTISTHKSNPQSQPPVHKVNLKFNSNSSHKHISKTQSANSTQSLNHSTHLNSTFKLN